MSAGALQRRTQTGAAARPAHSTDVNMAERVAVPDLARVYEAHFRYVWRCLRSLGVPDAQLDDALQDVFLVVQRKLAEFDGGAELRTWLYAIALRIARKYRDRARRAPDSLEAAREQTPELPAAPDANGEVALAQERLALARLALSALDDEKREIFVLARIEEMSAPEIAEVVGVPINTVYSRLRAARLAFEAEIARLAASARSSR
ncbi:MAG: sigma-70 family RNA polymerase sigma factor [Polyangiaceae bacterium]